MAKLRVGVAYSPSILEPAFGCVVMVEKAARDSHTILMVAICHLLVRVPHQIDQRRGLKRIHMAHRRQEANVVPNRLFNRASRRQERALREDAAHEALLPSNCRNQIHPQHLLWMAGDKRGLDPFTSRNVCNGPQLVHPPRKLGCWA